MIFVSFEYIFSYGMTEPTKIEKGISNYAIDFDLPKSESDLEALTEAVMYKFEELTGAPNSSITIIYYREM